ncbi:MAG: hypothetical protein M1835_000226 [Candelina submexicana]|nr:MAG: hypothetical protein M1835_000226 [Candelina submexicana]
MRHKLVTEVRAPTHLSYAGDNQISIPTGNPLHGLKVFVFSSQIKQSMFSSAICRAVRAHQSIPSYTTCITSKASITASSRQFTSRSHRRRYSSSKPSSPPDDPTKVAAQQQTPTSATTRTRAESDKRSVTRLSKRKVKGTALEPPPTTTVRSSKDETATNINIPSVPSTHHLHPADIAVSAFFSLHRPISITAAVPSTSTIPFNTIFDPQQRSPFKPTHQPSEVINTLNSVVQNLEATTQTPQQHEQTDEETDLRAVVTQASVSNAETHNKPLSGNGAASNNNSPLQFPAHLLSSKFKPFTPPPPPSPRDATIASSKGRSQTSSSTVQKSYSMGVTIHESTTPDGKVTYTAQITSPVLTSTDSNITTTTIPDSQQQQPSITPPPRFLDRMILRQQRWEDHIEGLMEKRGLGAKERDRVWAISVKRQRKLKMKKHKYKKLMKRTRNLRRRLDRL